MSRQKQIRMTQLIQAALNGPSMTIEELSDVDDAAMSEFEGLRCGKQTTLAFVQSGKGITPARKFRILLHTNPTRERGECLETRAGALEDM